MDERPPENAFFDASKSSSCNLSKPSEQNRVIIRIWMPHVNGQESTAIKAIKNIYKGNEANVGHTSIETPNQYASIWPHPDANVANIFKVYQSNLHSLADDERAEDGKCDIVVCLYSLNIAAIEDAFKEVRRTNLGYVLSGDFSLAEDGGQSCCGLTNALLRRGGILLLGNNDNSLAKIVTTPDGLAAFVKEIKAKELEKFKETRNFSKLENEYVPPLIVNKNNKCVLF